MPVLTVGTNSNFSSIAAAMISAGPGDTIYLEDGYSNETAVISFNNMNVFGDINSRGIVLILGIGIATVTLTGTAPFRLLDESDGNGIVGNAGNNHITVTGGVDAVDAYYPGELHAFHALVMRESARRCWRDTFAFLDERVPFSP